MVEIWADEACTRRPDSLTINSGDTLYFQVNRDFAPSQFVSFIGSEEDQGREQSWVECVVTVDRIRMGISLGDELMMIEEPGVINAGSVYSQVYSSESELHLLSFSLGPVISVNPTIVPNSICSVPMYFDSSEQVWMYAIACLNSNGECVFLEAANNATKVHVTTEKYDGIPVFAFTPSPLPAIGTPSGNVPFAFSAAYARQYGKHAPFSHRLDNVSEVEPGSYDYAIALLVNNTTINSQNLITGDESPLAIPIYHV